MKQCFKHLLTLLSTMLLLLSYQNCGQIEPSIQNLETPNQTLTVAAPTKTVEIEKPITEDLYYDPTTSSNPIEKLRGTLCKSIYKCHPEVNIESICKLTSKFRLEIGTHLGWLIPNVTLEEIARDVELKMFTVDPEIEKRCKTHFKNLTCGLPFVQSFNGTKTFFLTEEFERIWIQEEACTNLLEQI